MGLDMHPDAANAIRAARNWRAWGRWTATRFCQKRNVPMGLVTLARVLESAKAVHARKGVDHEIR